MNWRGVTRGSRFVERCTLLTCLLVLALSGSAPAWTLSFDGTRYVFDGDPGEENWASTWTSSGATIVSDSHNELAYIDDYVDANCTWSTSLGSTMVRCPYNPAVVLNGNDGDDDLTGSDGDDILNGGAGDDRLRGYGGNDVEDGGDGNDSLDWISSSLTTEQSGAGSDTLRGGPGDDNAGYSGRSHPVTIRLNSQADDGASGEGDNIADDIELVEGGEAGDVIVGNAAPNVLGGRGGNDEIHGGPGDDKLAGGSGDDRMFGEDGNDTLEGDSDSDLLDGGAGVDNFFGDNPCTIYGCSGGNDTLHARDGAADALACGVGADSATVDQFDTLSSDPQQSCETVDRATVGGGTGGGGTGGGTGGGGTGGGPGNAPTFTFTSPRRLRLASLIRRGVTITVNCVAACKVDAGLFTTPALARRLGVPARPGRIGRGRATRLAAGDARVTIRLTSRARRRIRRVRALKTLTLRVAVTDASAKTLRQTRALRILR
jgi:Ca2+-binding RTX toxin-like protein